MSRHRATAPFSPRPATNRNAPLHQPQHTAARAENAPGTNRSAPQRGQGTPLRRTQCAETGKARMPCARAGLHDDEHAALIPWTNGQPCARVGEGARAAAGTNGAPRPSARCGLGGHSRIGGRPFFLTVGFNSFSPGGHPRSGRGQTTRRNHTFWRAKCNVMFLQKAPYLSKFAFFSAKKHVPYLSHFAVMRLRSTIPRGHVFAAVFSCSAAVFHLFVAEKPFFVK